MLIRETPNRTRDKELKVKLPMRLHVKLYTLKMLKGVQICSVVEEALDRYFAEMRAAAPDVYETARSAAATPSAAESSTLTPR